MSILQRIAAVAVGLALFVLAFIFTSVILALAGGIALGVWAWLAWKTRKLRQQMEKARGAVIEGEYRVERETQRLDDGP